MVSSSVMSIQECGEPREERVQLPPLSCSRCFFLSNFVGALPECKGGTTGVQRVHKIPITSRF